MRLRRRNPQTVREILTQWITLPSRAPDMKPEPFGSHTSAVTVSECSVSVSTHTPVCHWNMRTCTVKTKEVPSLGHSTAWYVVLRLWGGSSHPGTRQDNRLDIDGLVVSDVLTTPVSRHRFLSITEDSKSRQVLQKRGMTMTDPGFPNNGSLVLATGRKIGTIMAPLQIPYLVWMALEDGGGGVWEVRFITMMISIQWESGWF